MLSFKTEDEVVAALEQAAKDLVNNKIDRQQAEGIAILAREALAALRQKDPFKHPIGGLFNPCGNPLGIRP